ncbi:hypothetical protein [Sphingobacterium deserti]|uniref:Uncharacterized protein n=1 Tax=Sphingobacterium deserti TaxID=1229276 RepID=A0A0B8T253_9SPHI|nr:hypothetical protein [Sphingobacterium deserti]KGE14916.1 hypothetical protein DI53_1416 [Sphingobacterium deserti]
MKSSQKINNLQDLKIEIARLNVRKKEQEVYLLDQYELLKTKVESPIRFIKNFTTVVPGAGIVKGVASNISKAMKGKDADWLTNVLQIGTPLVLNSTLLRNAGWLKKAVVLLASETAVGQVNQSKISSLIGKVTNFIRPKNKKKRKKKETIPAEPVLDNDTPDFGLPTNSETY